MNTTNLWRALALPALLPMALYCGCNASHHSQPQAQSTPQPAPQATTKPFITVWKGVAGEPLKIPIVGNYSVTWYAADAPNDRHTETVSITSESLLAHPYTFTPPRDGEYVIEAGPEGVEYMRMWVFDGEDNEYTFDSSSALLRVVQFGKVKWQNMATMFASCANMTFADTIDTPDLSAVRDMQGMFVGCERFNQPLEHWDVSQVTNMGGMLSGCTIFNQPLERWNVSRVEYMSGMFDNTTAFNQPLERWDVSQVKKMNELFYNCSAFNQPLAGWDVSQVETMENMFCGCSSFNQPLEVWNVSRVTNMNCMFDGCAAFNQPLGKWDVSRVEEMIYMFRGCVAFNQPLDQWKVKDKLWMRGMFEDCPAGNQPAVKGWKDAGDIE